MEIYFCFIEHALLLRSGCRLSSDGLLMAGIPTWAVILGSKQIVFAVGYASV